MPRFRLLIEYAGTRYSGWQIQKNARTVQGEIDRAVREVSKRREFELYGSGRTDAGVHALAQVAHLELYTDLPPEPLRHSHRRDRQGPSPLSRTPRCPRALLSVSDFTAPYGIRQIFRLVEART